MNEGSTPPSNSFSSDSAEKLERAIKYMVTTFLNGGLIDRAEVVNLLEDIIQSIERDPSSHFSDDE